MNMYRVYALLLRYLWLFRDVYRLFDITFWACLDILLWGFAGLWMQQEAPSYMPLYLLPLLGAFFWQTVLRSSFEILTSVLEELMTKNLSNLFSSPMTWSDWITSMMLLGIIKLSFVMFLLSVLLYVCYACNILLFGWWLVPLFTLLLMSGWIIGTASVSLIMIGGQRIQSFSWALTWIFTPLCGVFYDVEVLPSWMQFIGKGLPMTYTFKAIHGFIKTGIMDSALLWTSFWLNSIYLIAALIFFRSMFTLAHENGLSRLESE